MVKITRRNLLIAGAATTAIGGGALFLTKKKPDLGIQVTSEYLTKGKNLLRRSNSIDIHAHPGRSFVANATDLDFKMRLYALTSLFEDRAIDDMLAGGLNVASFSTVSDFQLLSLGDKGISATREFKKGEAQQSYKHQIQRLKTLLKRADVMAIKSADDIHVAKSLSKLGILFTAEGGDFLEGSLQHLKACYADGIRSITLMHYHVNEIGDIQTIAPVHHGLTKFGKQLIPAMNKQGILIDLAHASKATAETVLTISDQPVIVSHAGINREGFTHPRFIDLDLAQRVADAGGLIGAWPAGIGLHNFADYVSQIFHLIDAVGVNHVAIGTDMDGNYKPVFDDYTLLPTLAGALLQKGLTATEAGNILGGNVMRVLKQVGKNEGR